MNIINNIEVYNKNMSMSMYDKTFFIDKIDAKLFVDFGCAVLIVLVFFVEFCAQLKIGHSMHGCLSFFSFQN